MNDIGKLTQSWCEQSGRASTYAEVVDSTNEVAKNIPLSEGKHHIVIASHQSAGKGRGSNTWQDTAGHSLLGSWVFQSEYAVSPLLSPRVGLGLYRALKATWPNIDFNLKAPNDILISGKKVCGLLVETIQTGDTIRIIVGIGLNVGIEPEDLENSQNLQTQLTQIPSPAEWFGLLERIELELQLALFLNPSEALSSNECEQLKTTLNLNPSLVEKITQVLEDGSLQTANKVVSWREL